MKKREVRDIFLALCIGFAIGTAFAQSDPQAIPAADLQVEQEALERLAAQLAEQRKSLDERRRELNRERQLLLAGDRPADKAQLDIWFKRERMAKSLESDIDTLKRLKTVIASEALARVRRPRMQQAIAFVPSPGLARANLAVNLRDAPDGERIRVLQSDELVIRLASGGGWSVVATTDGIAFVPTAQLKQADGTIGEETLAGTILPKGKAETLASPSAASAVRRTVEENATLAPARGSEAVRPPRIVVRAVAKSYVLVLDTDGNELYSGLMQAGDAYEAPLGENLLLDTGNAGGLRVTVDGQEAPPLGSIGDVMRGIPLDRRLLSW